MSEVSSTQLALRFEPSPPLTLTSLNAVGLRPAVFYYALREQAAGRSAPMPLTSAQADLVEMYA